MNEFFSSNSIRTSQLRLKSLVDSGLINRSPDPRIIQQYFYFPTKRGIDFIYPSSNIGQGARYKTPSFEHDSCLFRLRKFFQDSKIIENYLTENMMMLESNKDLINQAFGQGSSLRPDALLTTTRKGKPIYIALEFELNQKNRTAYRQKIKKYKLKNNLPIVLFISPLNSIINAMKREEKELSKERKTKYYYANYDELLREGLPFIFKNCHETELNFY